jgi:hypothetical protein
MRFKWMPLFYVLVILALIPARWAYAASAAKISEQKMPPVVDERAQGFTKAVKRAGFEIRAGYFKQYLIGDCDYSYQVMGSCFLNNPAAPYVIPILPTWPEEWVDPATADAWGPVEDGYSGTYRLDPREAIVIMGILPPPARYFGIQSYLFTRQGTYDDTSDMYRKMSLIGPGMVNTFFHTIPGNSERVITFDSLSNAANNVVIEQQSGAAFNQMRYFIITPDQSMDKAIRKILSKAGVQAKDIFTEPIPSIMQTGLIEQADEFMTVIRYAEPENETLANEWRSNTPMVILRIRPVRQNWQPVPYPEVELEERHAVDEFPLKTDLDSLVSAVFDRWGQVYDPSLINQQIDFQSQFDFVGPLCEKIGMDCLADTQDASYQARPGGLTLDFGEVYAYVGALGTETGNATYASLGINNVLKKLGVDSVHDYELKGSANAYGSQVNNTGKLFIHYFARSCTGLKILTDGHCSEITPEMIPICADPTRQSCTRMMLTERDYLAPGTRRGPDSALILPGRIIRLQDPRQ